MSKTFRYSFYNNGIKTIKVHSGNTIPDGFVKGRLHQPPAWNKGLTAESNESVRLNSERRQATRKERGGYAAWNRGLSKDMDARVLKNTQRALETVKSRYGVTNVAQLPHSTWNRGLTKHTDDRMLKASLAHKGAKAWNKGLTTQTDSRVKSHPQTQDTRERIRQTHLDPAFQQQRFLKMKSKNLLGKQSLTKAELNVYKYLLTKYTQDDIVLQHFDIDRYPFKCDFYIKSRDLFIEVNSTWTHGPKPFNREDIECVNLLNTWIEKSKTSNYYKNAIYTWTDLDVRKESIAKANNLNIQFLYNSDLKTLLS